MNGSWAVCLDQLDAACLGQLRQTPQLAVCQQQDRVWLRGDGLQDSLQQNLKMLPGARRFTVLPDRQLVAAGTHVPKGYLPEGPWVALGEWLTVQLEAAALAGQLTQRVPVRLVRGAPMVEPNVLLTRLALWTAYGSTAAQVRLDRWWFAVGAAGPWPDRAPAGAADRSEALVVVRGAPVPPLAGQRFIEREGVAVPAGWAWCPAVEAAVLREVLGLQVHELALLFPEGTWERVAADDFVRATRAAIRMTAGITAND